MILDRVCAVSRLVADVGNAGKEAYSPVGGLEAMRINIQPASPEFTAITNGVFGKTFEAYLTASGIKDGDRITVSGSDTYTVRGVEDQNWGPLPHYRLVLFKAEG